MVCSFPGCKQFAQPNNFCVFHKQYSTTVIKKKKKPIAKRSDKMQAAMKEVKKLYKIFLVKFPVCQLDVHGCTKQATVIHHSRGREGDQLTNQKDWMASCTSCNLWVEENHGKAAELGLKKRRHHAK